MATVTYACHRCDATTQTELHGSALVCTHCATQLPCDLRDLETTELSRCVVCPSRDLFLRKDFSPRIGLTIVICGFIASTIAWAYYQVVASFIILFGTAAIDLLLYLTMGNLVECYCCHAQYRGLPEEGHRHFDLAIHERNRQSEARYRAHVAENKPTASSQ